jgi:hypothetical protein
LLICNILKNYVNSSISRTKDPLGEAAYQALPGFTLLAKKLGYDKRVIRARELLPSSFLHESFHLFDIIGPGNKPIIVRS